MTTADMSGYIYGHMIGNMLKDNAAVDKLVADYNNLHKVYGECKGVIADAAQTQRSFVCDDVGLRAAIRAITKEIRFVSPFNEILKKEVRDKIYGMGHEHIMTERAYNPEWLPQIANRVALKVLIEALKVELAKVSPQSDLLVERDGVTGLTSIYREHFDAEYKSKYSDKNLSIKLNDVDYFKIPQPKFDKQG